MADGYEDLIPASEHLRTLPGAGDLEHAVADWLVWTADHWTPARDVRHYSARSEMQDHARNVAEATMRLVEEKPPDAQRSEATPQNDLLGGSRVDPYDTRKGGVADG